MKRLVPSMTRELILSILIIDIFILFNGCGTATPTVELTPLGDAVTKGQIDEVKGLIDKADTNDKDLALIIAAKNGHTGIVKLLLDKGVNINARDKDMKTALMYAAWNGYTEIVRLLLDKGADVNKQTEAWRIAAVNAASKRGDHEWAVMLTKQWANLNMQIVSGNQTALIGAAWNGHAEIVRLLLDKGADVNKQNEFGWTALMYAAWYGRIEIVRLLMDKNADVKFEAYHGWTALALAAKNGHTEIVRLLMDKGADVNSALGKLATYSSDNDVPSAIMMLEKYDKEQKMLDEERRTASKSISKEELKTLVQAAVESSAETQKKETKTAVKTDIDNPSFSPSQIVMSENDLAVIIGIEGYQGIPKSDYSYDDAKLVSDYAKALGFKPRNIELLLEERATKSSIEKIIKTWLPNKAKSESRVFIYYSGHGAPEPKTGDAYIVPFDGDPNYLPDTGYPLKRLYDNLGKLQVAEVTVVLDACFSGAGGRSVLAKGARPLVMIADVTTLSQNIAVLSATQGTQISTSSPEKGHGLFTYYFLKAIKGGKKNIAEIYEYIKPLVEDEAKQLNVQQSPSINPDVEKLKGRFELRK